MPTTVSVETVAEGLTPRIYRPLAEAYTLQPVGQEVRLKKLTMPRGMEALLTPATVSEAVTEVTPTTCRGASGEAVPMPTSPVLYSIVRASTDMPPPELLKPMSRMPKLPAPMEYSFQSLAPPTPFPDCRKIAPTSAFVVEPPPTCSFAEGDVEPMPTLPAVST